MEPDELAEAMQRQYDRCKRFPEQRKDGWIALIELRNLAPRAIELLRKLARQARD
jgi:hypothetical protein